MNRIFAITRKGSFKMNSFCWEDGPRTLEYNVFIRRPKLDVHGFVVDNRYIDTFIASLEEKHSEDHKLSCEQIADYICNHLCEVIPDFISIRVSITGNPDATWLTAFAGQQENDGDDLGPLY